MSPTLTLALALSLAGKTYVYTARGAVDSAERAFTFSVSFPADGNRLATVTDDFWGAGTPDCDLRQSVTPCVERRFFYDLEGDRVTLFDRIDGYQTGEGFVVSAGGQTLTGEDGTVYSLKP